MDFATIHSAHSNEILELHVDLMKPKHCLEIKIDEQPKKRIRGPYRRIACRARSLSNDHNSDTAYFDIPCNAPHGLPLNCSHEECIKSGRRFRYCKVCELPVAKRNFVKRHGHSMVHSSKELKETVDRLVPGVKMKRILPVVSMDSSVGSTSFIEISTDDDSLDSLELSCHAFSRAVTPISCSDDKWLFSQNVRATPSGQTKARLDCAVEHMQSRQTSSYVNNPLGPVIHDSFSSPSIEACFHVASQVVPLVEPGATISASEFEVAIRGIDFAKVFD